MGRSLGLLRACAAALLLIGAPLSAEAQPRKTLVVGVVDEAAPCSNRVGPLYEGYAVEIWEAIASQKGWPYRFEPVPSPNAAVAMAASGAIDVGVSCLNQVPERLAVTNFSVAISSDGLAFLSPRENSYPLSALLTAMVGNGLLLRSLSWLFLVSLAGAVLLWLTFGRFRSKDVECATAQGTFFKGWMMLLMGSGTYKMSDSAGGILMVLVTNLFRLVIVSIFVGATAKTLIRESAPEDGNESEILASKLAEGVAVDAQTISETWLRFKLKQLPPAAREAAKVEPVSGDEQLIEVLRSGAVKHVLADSSRVSYLRNQVLASSDRSRYAVSAQVFNSTPQGFVFGKNLPESTQRQISVAIADLRFQGVIDAMVNRNP
ncbi:transporter substrate-binding domain-containing protein [Synechococcus sp. NOUM97013]|uniref:transporter substrate-binding domain-containing protein n=1 Tax=Synechococcus sp. NOUM97013 TaxID=1442555 RepID=UPI0016457C55|nr:transporter substrate-binding domain-containing protein [Synechococcus sp. NOUM97013]QNI74332.1 putative ligand gated channel (GIC family) [Synechococcus sp. NOUM97013]